MSRMRSIGASACSEDLGHCRGRGGRVHRPSCSCAARDPRRTARSTSTGTSSRTAGWPTHAWRSATCCTSGRSTPASARRGARPSRCATRAVRAGRWRCLLPARAALQLWRELDLDAFWFERLPVSREGTPWLKVLKTLVVYRLIDPGSAVAAAPSVVRCHCDGRPAGRGLRPGREERVVPCLDKLVVHKDEQVKFRSLARRG
jgi:hypothetical protein